MESKPTWDDVMQYAHQSFDTIVGQYWTIDNVDSYMVSVRLYSTQQVLLELSFSWCWSHVMNELISPKIAKEMGLEAVRQLGVSDKPLPLNVETLVTILYAVSHFKSDMFAGKRPNFY